MDADILEAMLELRRFMFGHVYQGTAAQSEEARARAMLKSLYLYFCDHIDELPADYRRLMDEGDSRARVACDYIACMTDRYSIATYKRLFIPKSWNKLTD